MVDWEGDRMKNRVAEWLANFFDAANSAASSDTSDQLGFELGTRTLDYGSARFLARGNRRCDLLDRAKPPRETLASHP